MLTALNFTGLQPDPAHDNCSIVVFTTHVHLAVQAWYRLGRKVCPFLWNLHIVGHVERNNSRQFSRFLLVAHFGCSVHKIQFFHSCFSSLFFNNYTRRTEGVVFAVSGVSVMLFEAQSKSLCCLCCKRKLHTHTTNILSFVDKLLLLMVHW